MPLPAPPRGPNPLLASPQVVPSLTPPPDPNAQPAEPSDEDVINAITEKARTDPTILALQRDKEFMRGNAATKARMWTAVEPKIQQMDPQYKIEVMTRLFAGSPSEQAKGYRRDRLIEEANSLSRPENSFWGGVGNTIKSIPNAIGDAFNQSTPDSGLAGGLVKSAWNGEVSSRQTAMDNAVTHLQPGTSPQEKAIGVIGATGAVLPVPMSGYVGDFAHRMFEGEPNTVAGEAVANAGMAYAGAGANKILGKVLPTDLPETDLIRTKTVAERSGSETMKHIEQLAEKSIPGASPFADTRRTQALEVGQLIKDNFVAGLKKVVSMPPQERGAAIQQIFQTYKDEWTRQYEGMYQKIDADTLPGQQQVTTVDPTTQKPITKTVFTAGRVPVKIDQLVVDGKPFTQWAQDMADFQKARKQFGTDVDGAQAAAFAAKMLKLAKQSKKQGGVAAALVRNLRDADLSPKVAEAFKPVRDQLTGAMKDAMNDSGRMDLATSLDVADSLRNQAKTTFDREIFKKMLDDGTAKASIPYLLGKMSIEDLQTVRSMTLAKAGGRQMWRQWAADWFESELTKRVMADPEQLRSTGGVQAYQFLSELDHDGRLATILGKDGRAKAFQFSKELRQLNLSGQKGVTAMGAIPALNAIFGGVTGGTAGGVVGGGITGSVAGTAIGGALGGVMGGGAAVASMFVGFRLYAYALSHPEMLAEIGKISRGLNAHNVAAVNSGVLGVARAVADKDAEKGTVPNKAYEFLRKTTDKAEKSLLNQNNGLQ